MSYGAHKNADNKNVSRETFFNKIIYICDIYDII